jgi:exosortase/archaeosortase family protein
MAGVSHGISGSTIVLQNPYLAFDITAGCLGGVLYWAYIALVMAESEASIKQRLTGVFTGLVILFAFNFLRLILSIYVEWLTGVSIHGYFYIFNMIFVLLVWFGWLWTIRRGRARFIRSMA